MISQVCSSFPQQLNSGAAAAGRMGGRGAHGGAGTAGQGAGVPLGKVRKTPDADFWPLIEAHAHAWAGVHARARAGSDIAVLCCPPVVTVCKTSSSPDSCKFGFGVRFCWHSQYRQGEVRVSPTSLC